MLARNPYNQYKQDSIFTATPGELTLMLYNGAIKFIMQGEKNLNEKKWEDANASLQRAQAIINELSHTLDMKYEISNNFKVLYDYINSRIIEANTKKDVIPLQEALRLTTEFRDTWQQAMKLARIQEAKMVSKAASSQSNEIRE